MISREGTSFFEAQAQAGTFPTSPYRPIFLFMYCWPIDTHKKKYKREEGGDGLEKYPL